MAFLLLAAPLLARALQPAPELFSPCIYLKVLNTFESLPNPIKYPEYTDSIAGKWLDFAPDTWTSGFLPATAYALHTRNRFCPDDVDWLALGRASAGPLVPLEAKNTLGHDVGFLSYPFVDEIAVFVL
jgi:hypothetical protein